MRSLDHALDRGLVDIGDVHVELDRLPKTEKLVLSLYYLEDLRLKEIALILEVSESRVSQIHTQALQRLTAAMRKAHSL